MANAMGAELDAINESPNPRAQLLTKPSSWILAASVGHTDIRYSPCSETFRLPTYRPATRSCCRSRLAGQKYWVQTISFAGSMQWITPVIPIAAVPETAFQNLANLATKAGVEGAGFATACAIDCDEQVRYCRKRASVSAWIFRVRFLVIRLTIRAEPVALRCPHRHNATNFHDDAGITDPTRYV